MSDTIQIIVGGSVALVFFLILSLSIREKSEDMKRFLFYSMTAVAMFVTLFLVFDTILENRRSVTGGPVHWHADFQIWACGERQDLQDPTGLANRIGTPLFHEHGDERIHVEGAVRDFKDVSLASFFEVIGGELTRDSMTLPTNQGLISFESGNLCDGEPGTWQVFRYKTEGKYVIQEKLQNFPDYVLSPESVVPPGDCLIFEFSAEEKERTERICDFYAIDIEQGKLEFKD